ncbi:MAG: putative metalloprotease CJM1_0395 family protein [Acidobacteriota bacterium]
MQVGLFTAQSTYITPSAQNATASGQAEGNVSNAPENSNAPAPDDTSPTEPVKSAGKRASAGQQLSSSELELVRHLAARDREVRAHEQAHLAAAGGYATSGPSFSYQTGPDGVRYAVGGEVGIDTSPVSGNPRATLAKAQAIIAAANAPAEPSSQDRAVAAAAAQMAARAQAEISQTVAVAAYAGKVSTKSSTFALAF